MKHICHISVLNPLRHSRIYYRWGLGARELGHEVSILAQGEAKERSEDGIELMGTGKFHRLSLNRFLFSYKQKQSALQTKADIYVLHSPELLGLGKWLKVKTGAKLIYDVHEDYHSNILHANHYPKALRKSLAKWVRNKEIQTLSFLDAVVYAEECYEGILPVMPQKSFILRNKFTPQAIKPTNISLPEAPYMLYTGTLAWPWGIKETYDFWKAYKQIFPLRLVVAGFDARGEVVDELEKRIQKDGSEGEVEIIGGKEYVSYDDILALIKGCFCGTAFYHLQPNIIGKVPTKFYEYMAMRKPLLFSREKAWRELNVRQPFGVDVSFGEWNEQRAMEKIHFQLKNWEPANLPKESYDFCGELGTLKSLLEGLNH